MAESANDNFLELFNTSVTNLKSIVGKTTSRLTENTNFNATILARLTTIKGNTTKILVKITDLKKKIDLLKTHIASLGPMEKANNQEIANLNKQITTLQEEKSQLTQQLNAANTNIKGKEDQIAALTKSLDDGTQSQKQAADNITKLTTEHESAIAAKEALLKKCNDDLAALQTNLAAITKELAENKTNDSAATQEVARLKEENKQLLDEKTNLVNVIKTATGEITSAYESINQIINAGDDKSQTQINAILKDIDTDLTNIGDLIDQEIDNLPMVPQGLNDPNSGSGAGEVTTAPVTTAPATTAPATTAPATTAPAKIQATPAPTAKKSSKLTPEQLSEFNNSLKILNTKISNSDPNDTNKRLLYSKTRTSLQNAINSGDAKTATEILSRPPFLNKGQSVQGGKTKKRRRQRGGFVVGKTKKREKISSIRRGSLNRRRRGSRTTSKRTGTRTTSKRTGTRTTSKRTTSKRTTSKRTGTRTTSY